MLGQVTANQPHLVGVNEFLQSLQLPNPLPSSCIAERPSRDSLRYEDVVSSFTAHSIPEDAFRVKRTGPDRVKQGNLEILAYLNADDIRELGLGRRAVAFVESVGGESEPSQTRMLTYVIGGLQLPDLVSLGILAVFGIGALAVIVASARR